MSHTFSPLDRLDGQTVVITGGTGAIAGAAAMRLAHLGARIVLLHRGGPEKSAALLQSLPGTGHGAVSASVTHSHELSAAAQQVQQAFGGAQILINCAGHTQPVPASDLEGLTDAQRYGLALARLGREPGAAATALAELLHGHLGRGAVGREGFGQLRVVDHGAVAP